MTRTWNNPARILPVLILAWGMLMHPAPAGGQSASRLTSEQVQAAVRKAVAYLRQSQQDDGTWAGRGYPGGNTALCVLALLNQGASADDPAVAKGIRFLQSVPDQQTYVVSLKCQVYAAADPKAYRRELVRAVRFLVRSQHANGMWGYMHPHGGSTSTDNSNTQFALLGLHEAAKAGIPVPARVWSMSRKHFISSQNTDGGWSYRPGHGRGSYGSMTAAAVASLYICGQRLQVGGPRIFVDGAYPGCGKYQQNTSIARGLGWLDEHFTVRENPGHGAWPYYYLYGLERVGMIAGLRTIGPHDWYRQGAARLVASQSPVGAWDDRAAYKTAFALLFLAKGNRPVLIQKVQWDGLWNRNIHDLEHLTTYISDKWDKPVTWQTTSLKLPLEQLRQGPILLVTGHEFPEFTQAEKDKLRRFASEAGGTLLLEACCGSEAFARGARELCNELWPEYTLRPLTTDHPVFNAHYKLDDTYGLEGLDSGCRTSVFFSPRALSCLWELQTIAKHSEQAFRVGTNIAAYATGSTPLRDRLAVVELPPPRQETGEERTIEVPRGAVRIARIIHDGDYNSDPHAMVRLAALLRDKARVDVVSRSRHIRPRERAIYEYPIVFMHGHNTFELSKEDREGLKTYLQRGGFLLAESCCGRKAFDRSFRAMVRTLFGDDALQPLPADHPIYSGQTGVALGELQYRPVLAKALGNRGTNRPPIEAVVIDGRTAILYSRYDFTCALEGDQPFSCRGYSDTDGQRLALALVLYALGE